MSKTHEIPESPQTPEEILKNTASRFNNLHLEAERALYVDNSSDMYKQKLIERATLIAELPRKIHESMEKGQSFPTEGLEYLYTFSRMAQEFIETDNDFGMGVLLVPWGSRKGEPNSLEKLIDRLYPS